MFFNSIDFVYFISIVYAVYFFCNHRQQNVFLLGASYLFYSAWDWRFLSLILISTIIDYHVGKRLHRETIQKRRLLLLFISLGSNLSILGFFKYFNFFKSSFTELLSVFGYTPDYPTLDILLPVGISFYTFQTLSYTIDIYRKELKPVTHFLDFALFVAFFPQLVAGPIERAANLLPQIEKKRCYTFNNAKRGAYLILIGMFKKVVIANGAAPVVDAVFNSTEPQSGIDVAIATVFFAVQIYGDFSGYSDIARGVAKTLGFDFMINFNTPYFSKNPQEFWKRWHISLSTWLRDYLYIGLGGNRGRQFFVYRNLMLTMVLGGLWHGAAGNFILWGAYHGSLLCIHRYILRIKGLWPRQLKIPLQNVIMIITWFILTCYGWLLFRAGSFDQIVMFTKVLLLDWSFSQLDISKISYSFILGLPILILLDLSQYLIGSHKFISAWPLVPKASFYTIMFIIILIGTSNAPVEFIYFQF